MGQINSKTVDYVIHVTTGDKKGAGTDGNIFVSLIDEAGARTRNLRLDTLWKDDFEAGNTDSFPMRDCPDFKHIAKLDIWRDNTRAYDNWYVDNVVVERCEDKDESIFPIHRWIPAKCRIQLQEFDCVLPQYDNNIEQRKKELVKKKEIYKLKVQHDGLTAQISEMPADESFSFEYRWDLKKAKIKLGLSAKFMASVTGRFKTLDSLEKIYGSTFEAPYGLENWRKDVEFGSQRLTGCNPMSICLCQSIPENFPVTPEMVDQFLEGQTLKDCLDNKKIYIVDFKILEGVECRDKNTLCAPLGLFYVNKIQKLMPIAIQLNQTPSDTNPIFLPSDPEYTWMLAKMWFNNSDFSFHQAAIHLGLTHFIMEFVAVVTNRQLSPSHPLFRLLAPHFLYLIAINTLGLGVLVSPGGWVDKTTTMGGIGMFNIISRALTKWRLDREGTLPNDLKNRGVDDADALPNYHYRDDALLIYGAIEKYVKAVVSGIYDTPQKILDDYELHNWIQELKTPSEGPGLNGLPKMLTTVEDICNVVTPLIFQASVQHAAVNFSQYDQSGFPPNYPGVLQGKPPSDKKPRSEEDIVNSLGTKSQIFDIMIVTKILSGRGTNALGDFEVQYCHDPITLTALDSFRKDLAEIDNVIKKKDETRDNKYPYLCPSEIPNAISI